MRNPLNKPINIMQINTQDPGVKFIDNPALIVFVYVLINGFKVQGVGVRGNRLLKFAAPQPA